MTDLIAQLDAAEAADTTPVPTPGTDIATLTPVARALVVLKSEQTEKDLKALIEKSKDITEVKNADGREQVHRMAMNLRTARTTITKAGKAARDDANAFCSAILAEEKRLLAISEAEEKRVFELRDSYDAKVKAEAADRERKEKERKDAINAKIDEIAQLPVAAALDTAAELAATIADLEAFEPSDEDFAEFKEVAKNAANAALAGLRALHNAASAREQMEAQLAEQKRQLDEQAAQLKAQQEELDRRQAEQRAEQERIEGARREAAEQMAAGQARAAESTREAREIQEFDELERAEKRDGLDDGVPLPEVTRTTHTVPAGWDKIEGDTVITPEVHARESSIKYDGKPVYAPLTWDTMGERPAAESRPQYDPQDPGNWRDGEACEPPAVYVAPAEHIETVQTIAQSGPNDIIPVPAGFTDAGLARVVDALNAAPDIVELRFEGYSDDTFGEYALTGDDFDNCGSGRPIRWLVTHPDVPGGVVVVGQHGMKGVEGFWMIGVAAFDPDHEDLPLPEWPMQLTRGERPYSPALVIEAPAGVVVRCLEREEIEENEG